MTKSEQRKKLIAFIMHYTDMTNLDRMSESNIDKLTAFILLSIETETPTIAVHKSIEFGFVRTKNTFVNKLNRNS